MRLTPIPTSILIACAAPLAAEVSPVPWHDGWLIAAEAHYAQVAVGEVAGTVTSALDAFGTTESDLEGGGGSLSVRMPFGAWTGMVRGRMLQADGDSSAASPNNTAGFFRVDGPGANGDGGATASAETETEYDQWSLAALTGHGLDPMAGFALQYAVGLGFARGEHDNEHRPLIDGLGSPALFLTDSVDTQYVMAIGRIDATTGLAAGLLAGIGLELQLGYAQADLSADQRIPPAAQRFVADDSDDALAARVTLDGEIGWRFGPIATGLGLGVDWLSYAPVANHPTSLAENGQESQLEDDDLLVLRAGVFMRGGF